MRMRNSPPSHSPSETSTQVGHDRGRQPGPRRQRSGRGVRALERGDEDRAQVLAREAHGDRLGLRRALGRERRVAVPVEQRERLARHRRRRRAVAHEDHLGGARRERELTLVVGLGHRAEYHNAVRGERDRHPPLLLQPRRGRGAQRRARRRRDEPQAAVRPAARAAAGGRGAGGDGRRRRGGRVVGHRQLAADGGRRLRAVAARGVRARCAEGALLRRRPGTPRSPASACGRGRRCT